MEQRIYESKYDVAKHFADYFVELIQDKEQFTVALSGGSTPKSVFDLLAENYQDRVDWSKIHFYWGDERCVGPDHPDSNFRMTVDHLFSKIEIPKENIHRIKGENHPEEEAVRYARILDEQLECLNGCPRFDLVMLGLGEDGHTASIFPHECELWYADEYCVVATHPDTGQQRISINGRIINNAEEVLFLVTGDNKSSTVAEVLENKAETQKKYPAALVQPATGNLIWFLDKAAASKLKKY